MRGRRRWRVAAGLAALLAVAVVGLLALGGLPAGRVGHASPASPWLSKIVGRLSAATALPVAADPALDPHGPEERQVCGGAWVELDAEGGIEGDVPADPGAVTALREATIARLRDRADAYSRAVAVWLGDDDAAALVGAALGTADARVYALAFRSCRRRVPAPESACSLLSAAQWSRLDPDNAAPWVFALDDATARRDAGGIDEALFQIGRSQRVAEGLFQPLLPVLDAVPSGDAAVLPTFALALKAAGRSAALTMAYGPLRGACSGVRLAEANRRQVCGRVAEVLAERSDDLLARMVGAGMVTESTGSPAREERQRAEFQAWAAASQEGIATPADALGCMRIRQSLDRLREQAAFGEVGAMRRWIEQSGLTPKDLLDRSRAFDARLVALTAKAASAADAASGPP